jgi:ABC-type glycerol-3-phosphate transport system substrate-binding protein
MRKIVMITAFLVLASAMVFAAGQKSTQSTSGSDGLSVVKVYGVNRQPGQVSDLKLSDWYEGKVPSKFWDKFQEDLAKYGVKLQIDTVMSDQANTNFQTMIVSGKLDDYDFVTAGYSNLSEAIFANLYNQGKMYPMNKAIDQYSKGPAKTFYSTSTSGVLAKNIATMPDGNFYWLTSGADMYYKSPDIWANGNIQVAQIRYDWLKTLGLDMPRTADEFVAALEAFQKNDMNKNGIKDEEASISMSGFNTGVAQWFGLANDLVGCLDNKVISPWYQPKIKDYITYMNSLYKKGLLRTETGSISWAANRIAYECTWNPVLWREGSINVPAGAEKPYMAPFIATALPDTSPVIWAQSGYTRGFDPHFIPAKAKNIAGVAALIDYLVSPEYTTLSEYGIEGYSFKYNDKKEMEKITDLSVQVGHDLELAASGTVMLWTDSAILPRHKNTDVIADIQAVRTQGYGLKADFNENVAFAKKYPILQDIPSTVAFPTEQEMARLQEITPDLTTYSSELLTALIMGDKSLANWDTYMTDLKRLGLDEYISIYQARFERGRLK